MGWLVDWLEGGVGGLVACPRRRRSLSVGGWWLFVRFFYRDRFVVFSFLSFPKHKTHIPPHTHTHTNHPTTHVSHAGGLDDVQLVGGPEGVVARHDDGGAEGAEGVVEGEEVHELRQAVGEDCGVCVDGMRRILLGEERGGVGYAIND